jgi:hypothetical protein
MLLFEFHFGSDPVKPPQRMLVRNESKRKAEGKKESLGSYLVRLGVPVC